MQTQTNINNKIILSSFLFISCDYYIMKMNGLYFIEV